PSRCRKRHRGSRFPTPSIPNCRPPSWATRRPSRLWTTPRRKRPRFSRTRASFDRQMKGRVLCCAPLSFSTGCNERDGSGRRGRNRGGQNRVGGAEQGCEGADLQRLENPCAVPPAPAGLRRAGGGGG